MNPNDAADVKAVHALQDAIKVEQKAAGKFEVPDWDQASLEEGPRGAAGAGRRQRRDRLGADVRAQGAGRSGPAPARHGRRLGRQSPNDAFYAGVEPKQNDGKTAYRLTVKDVPVDGFWSVSVYNKDGFFEKNARNAYTVNNVTAKPNADGSVTIQFGGDARAAPNCIPIMPGWNYLVRMYRPRKEILDGTWKFPEATPVG